MMKQNVLLFFSLVFALVAKAQRSEVLVPHIATLQVVADDNPLVPPVIDLGSDSRVTIAFDDLTHEARRYTYKVEHCAADWTTSDRLFASDYLEGFADGLTIDDNALSINTNQNYTHYTLSLPNDRCRFTMSGNYRVTVMDNDDNDRPVLRACFMVAENTMTLAMSVNTNTDRGLNNGFQQVGLTLNYGNARVVDPQGQVHVVVTQNQRWDNARINPKPQFLRPDGLTWDHCADLIFDGGNEYRKFETLSLDNTTMGIERLNWDGQAYHVYLFTDEPRPNYVYDEDANGAFFIRNSDNIENTTTTDYLWVHFTLKAPRQQGRVVATGQWLAPTPDGRCTLEWDEATQCYRGKAWLKQGYYNYEYRLLRPDGTETFLPSEGSFSQTHNSYQAYVYYKEVGGKADRLVAKAVVE